MGTVGLEDRRREGWHHWLGEFTPNELLPGEPEDSQTTFSAAAVTRRALQLIGDFLASLPDAGSAGVADGLRVSMLAAVTRGLRPAPRSDGAGGDRRIRRGTGPRDRRAAPDAP